MVKRQVSFKINNDIDKWVQDQTDSKDGNKPPFESVSDLVNTALQYYKNRKEFEASMQETILTFMKSNPAVKKELERLMREIISQKSR